MSRLHPALALVALLAAAPAAAADSTDQDWPCRQRKVDEISAGQIWTGPSLQDVGDVWQQDQAVADLARKIAARRTTLDEAKDLIGTFADGAGTDKNGTLTKLAAGVLSVVNGERGSIIAGIERYARRQRALAEKIEQQRSELDKLPAGTAAEQSRRADLQEIEDWDTRIFEERERSLTYVCELPVQLEQRAFALGRAIASHLDP